MQLHVNDQSGLRGLPSLLTFDLQAVLRESIFGPRGGFQLVQPLVTIMPGIPSVTRGRPTYSAPIGATAFDPNTLILYINMNGAFQWTAIDLSLFTLKVDFEDLERRFRLLLSDYIQKFGEVPGLGDENQRALETSAA